MGESSFWYRPTRVVPDQRPLNGRCVVVVRAHVKIASRIVSYLVLRCSCQLLDAYVHIITNVMHIYHAVFFLLLVLLGLVFSVPSQEIGWKERLRNDLFCVECDVKNCSIYLPSCVEYS